jgi:DNA polymerase III delta prime subunit
MIANLLLDSIKTHSTIIISGTDDSVFSQLVSEIKSKTSEYLILEKTDDSKNLLTDDVETIQSFIKNKSHTSRYVITNKSIRNTVLQNKILKLLEEGGENIFIIILQESISYLLPTVLSRCQVIDMTHTEETLINKKKLALIKNKKYKELLELLEIENAGVHGTITNANVNDYIGL